MENWASRHFQSSNRSFSTLGAPLHLSTQHPRAVLIYLPPSIARPPQRSRARQKPREAKRIGEQRRVVLRTATDRGSCASAAAAAVEMVVLTEEFNGLSLKRKGAHEPGLFDDAGDRSSGFSLSCRATKMRRLACPYGPRDGDDQTAVGGAATAAWEGGEDDAMVAAPSPSPGAIGGDDERAVVVYGNGDGTSGSSSSRRIDAPRLRADWIRAMLREADSRTVRELLAGAALERGSESDLALAIVQWEAPTSAAEEVATEEASDSAAAMDVEGDDKGQEGGRPWAGHGHAYGGAAGEGLVYRWPQHCWAAPAPAVAQASPVMWSW